MLVELGLDRRLDRHLGEYLDETRYGLLQS